jgi:hypothetical protein
LPLASDSHDWKNDWHIWLPLACISWWLAWEFQDAFISDWDGFDYTTYTVEHLPSALGLSRALFLGYNYALWEISHRWLGVRPEEAYLVLRYGAIAMSGPATIGIYALSRELSGGRFPALLSSLFIAASPHYIIYSGRAMSEIPAILMLGWSLWWMLRSLRRDKPVCFLAAAALVGMSANIREFALFYLPFIPIAAWIHGRKWRMGFAGLGLAVVCAFAGMVFWAWFDTDNYIRAVTNWYRLSAEERGVHPVTIANLRYLAEYAFNCSAAATILAPLSLVWIRARTELRALLWLGVFGLLADLALVLNHDLAVNPRYLLTGSIGLAPACGYSLAALIKQYRMLAAPLILGLLVLTKATYNHSARDLYNQSWSARRAKNYIAKIEDLPWNSAFIVGARTPLIHFYAGVGARPYWKAIAPGAPWPDDKLGDAIQDFFHAGRMVYVDFDTELWLPGARGKTREPAGLEMIKEKYRLEHIRDSIYRIVEPL